MYFKNSYRSVFCNLYHIEREIFKGMYVLCLTESVGKMCKSYSFIPTMLQAPTTEKEWEVIAREIGDLWQFPHCIGALDGKHIAFSPSQCVGSSDNKKFDSVVLLAVVDARHHFTLMDMICSNFCCDTDVFFNSRIGIALQENWLHIPEEKVLNGGSIPVPYVVVAGDAFSL
ncbi:uncharacterized protein LOC124777734 [Schistocerca piceifrons]|uniref:uncharacterized protein LOC124777734 n=1 Tax=Schistocerca piceifrons TaxID=274613 RepID=UPI001F5F3643|nr:uncharacterized protein LOC124777734 [Schistocerca piceifrons]